MNQNKSEPVSTYQQYLPIILQEDIFIGRFLLAFENILTGLNVTSTQEQIITGNTQNPAGLEQIIDNIDVYFNPQETPEDFLPWLAGWVALSLRDDWQVEVKRAFIRQIVGLYRLRGTKPGLTEILGLYLKNSGFGAKVEVFDNFDNFSNYFQVRLTLKDRDPDKYWRQAKIAQAIIDREKPAQTFYSLKILVPTMQLTQRSQVSYTLLFQPIAQQTFTIEVKITPSQSNTIPISQLAEQLIIQFQGNSTEITPDSSQIIIEDRYFSINYELNYQHFQYNLEGFHIKLSNRTDKDFVGNLAIKLYLDLNQIEHSNLLLDQPIHLSPVLKICRLNNAQELIAGNTIFQKTNQGEKLGMRITEYMWTSPYGFQTFTAPKVEQLQSDMIAIIEKIELQATVEITEPNPVSTDVLNKVAVRLKDKVSDFHLFTPETSIENNKIIIKRTIYYQHFWETLGKFLVIIKNLNNIDISGRLTVRVFLEINQRLSSYKVIEENFNLTAVFPYNILQICRKNEAGEIITGEKIPTILGTTSQSLN